MPNYSLVIGSKFRPFSYQEMLAPVLQQTQAHQQVEESYATLAAEADQWKNIAMSEPNSKAAETYMQYARDLESQADMLATKGLSLNSRRDAFKMAQRYQSEMLPIQQAYTTKMKDIEAQRIAGPDAVFSYDANNRSIDEYIANPMATYETLDLNKVFTAAATDIGQIKGALTDLQKNGRLDAFHKYYAQVKGLTPEEAALTSRAMETGDWRGVDMSKPQNQFVYNAMNRVYSMYKQPWMNSDQYQKLKYYIARGAAYGMGTTDIHAYEDFSAKENYKAAKAKVEKDNAATLRHYTQFNEHDPKVAAYKKAIESLKVKDKDGNVVGLKASVFGKNGTAAALKAYEEFDNLYDKTINNSIAEAYSIPAGSFSYATRKKRIEDAFKDPNSDLGKEVKKIKDKNGVTEFLTAIQYEALKAVGYDNSKMSVNALDNLWQNAITKSEITSFDDFDYDRATDLMQSRLGILDADGNFKAYVYEVDKYGNKKSGVKKLKNLNIYSSSNKEGDNVTDISYNIHSPNELIVTIGSKRYSVPVEVFGTEASNLVGKVQSTYDINSLSSAEKILLQDDVTRTLEQFSQIGNPSYQKTSKDRD